MKQLFRIEMVKMIEATITHFKINDNQLLDKSKIVGFDIEIGGNIKVNEAKELIKIILPARLSAIDKKNQQLDYAVELQGEFTYFIPQLDKFLGSEKGTQSILEIELGVKLAEIAYSTFRGMIIYAGKGTLIEHFILPVIDPATLFDATI